MVFFVPKFGHLAKCSEVHPRRGVHQPCLLFVAESCSTVWTENKWIFVYPFISWWLFGLFSLLGCNEECCYEYSRKSFCTNVFSIHLRSKIVGSYVNALFHILSNCPTIFQSDCILLHSHQQQGRALISPHPLRHWLLSFFFFCHLHGYEVVYHHGFDLPFPDG